MKLSKNFRQAEFACNCGKCGDFMMDVGFIMKLQRVRTQIGQPMRVNSGYRCAAHNAAVGGSRRSQHLLGKAADIHCPTSEYRDRLVKLATEAGLTGIGVYINFVHLDMRDADPVQWVGQ